MRMPRIACLGVLLCLSPWSAPAAARDSARPVALVYLLSGEATLRAPARALRPLRLFDRLPEGTTVQTGAGSRLAVAFANGRRYEVGERSRVTLGRADLSSRVGRVRLLPPVPPLPRLLAIADEDRPGWSAGAVRIRAERIAGLYPRCGAAVLAGTAVLHFELVEGGGRYRIEVQDPQGDMAFETETTASAVEVPAGRLKPGLRYHWTVRTLERVGPVARGDADFIVLSSDLAKSRERLQKAVGTAGDGAWALLAEVDRDLGLLAEARDELRAAALSSPEDLVLAGSLARLEWHLEEGTGSEALRAARVP